MQVKASNIKSNKPILFFVAASAAFAGTSFAQYAVNWSTIDGGGGTSTGGVYTVSGSIGQPDAGPTMTNGQYAVTGGFWALPRAVQTPGAPLLSITAAGPALHRSSGNRMHRASCCRKR